MLVETERKHQMHRHTRRLLSQGWKNCRGFRGCRTPVGLIPELSEEDAGRKEACELGSLQRCQTKSGGWWWRGRSRGGGGGLSRGVKGTARS